MATFSKTHRYFVNFQPIFATLHKELDDFYFYPKGLHGFIESCVLATQRDTDLEARTSSIMDELMGAMDEWSDRESDHEALQSGTWINGRSMNRYHALKIVNEAVAIDTYVYNAMSLLYEVHGELSISAKSFTWTSAQAMVLEVTF